jgi:hypothetical protein
MSESTLAEQVSTQASDLDATLERLNGWLQLSILANRAWAAEWQRAFGALRGESA